MPRRIFDYPSIYFKLNFIETIGASITMFGLSFMILNIFIGLGKLYSKFFIKIIKTNNNFNLKKKRNKPDIIFNEELIKIDPLIIEEKKKK